MTYYAKPNHINYDEWFDENIDPMDLVHEKENRFCDSVHEKFYQVSIHNLMIGGSEFVQDLKKPSKCSADFCPITDEELDKL